jgi:hypothetical protein
MDALRLSGVLMPRSKWMTVPLGVFACVVSAALAAPTQAKVLEPTLADMDLLLADLHRLAGW